MNEIDKFIESFKQILDEPDNVPISSNTLFKDLEEWDSLTNLSLMAMVDSDFNVKLNADEIKNCNTISDLFNTIISKM